MRLPSLDERLQSAASLFPACRYGADIGADHGRLSCYLLANDVCARMCVADISAESLQKARRLLTLHALALRADFCVGDGLTVLPEDAQCIAILGMGGHTLSSILQTGRDRLHGAKLVLSAHTELCLVRRTLEEMDYIIEDERIARAAGRFYVVLRACAGRETLSERQRFLGPRLSEANQPRYAAFLRWRIGQTACGKTPEAAVRLQWLKEESERVGDGLAD